MEIIFAPIKNSYVYLDTESKTKWVSVTTLVGALKNPFDTKAVADKCAANKKKTNKGTVLLFAHGKQENRTLVC